MRSRYSAYALGLLDYVMATTHPDGDRYDADTTAWRRGLQQFSELTSFDDLHILDAPEKLLRQTGQFA